MYILQAKRLPFRKVASHSALPRMHGGTEPRTPLSLSHRTNSAEPPVSSHSAPPTFIAYHQPGPLLANKSPRYMDTRAAANAAETAVPVPPSRQKRIAKTKTQTRRPPHKVVSILTSHHMFATGPNL